MKNKKKIVMVLSVFIIILSAIAAMIGIFSNQIKEYADVTTSFGETIQLYNKGLYARDSISTASQAIAQDVVTLVVAIPLLIISLYLVKKKSKKGLFLLTGTVGYFLYTYTSYAFLVVFNALYLVYVVLMILSFYSFILCLMELNQFEIREMVSDSFPRKTLSVFFFAVGIMLMGMWLGRILPALMNGSAPVGLEHYSTLGIQTLDLGWVVPASIVTAYLLRKENKWGYLLAIVFVIKMITMTAAVSAMIVFMQINGVAVSVMEKILFPVLLLISIYFMAIMWRKLKA
ncbi:MAG: hypothetical protein PUF65_00425 [Lachnospiraceae bacterium]|nr:hypothetical protein [Lachnospiraceae bacterium]